MIILAVLALSALLPHPQEEAPVAEPITLTYGWPTAGGLRVTEHVTKKGRKSVVAYTLSWAPDESGAGMLLEHEDFEFVSIEGLDLTNPFVRAGLKGARSAASVIPSMHIGPDGFALGLEGMDVLLSRMFDTVFKGMKEKQAAALRRTFEDPNVRQLLESNLLERWAIWVSRWIGTEVVRGESFVWELDMEETGGVIPELEFSIGKRADFRGLECVEISTSGEADEDILMRRTLQMMGLFADASGVELPDELPLARTTRIDTTWGLYAVDGLRPLRVRTASNTRLWESESSEPIENTEVHEYTFEWEDLDPE